jgi:2,3-dihydroxybenzoate decarboxylase
MHNKIVLEEHFAIEETLGMSEQYARDGSWSSLCARLLDLDDLRVSEMDRHGIELAILSLNAPGIQAISEARRAIDTARRANDVLASAVARRAGRLAGFAALPMQDPEAASAELVRCVRDLGFKGALVNGFSQVGSPNRVIYCDDAAYEPLWQTMEELGVPFYLHPRDPLPRREPIYDGHPWLLGPVWAFGVETGIHALRLMASGLFDRHPRLQMILGHLGEGLPPSIWRCDHRLAKSPRGVPARRTMTDYLRSNVHLTTSGNFHTPTLVNAIAEIGSDRVMFSVDYPFEDAAQGAKWFDEIDLSEPDQLKIGRLNAARLLSLFV